MKKTRTFILSAFVLFAAFALLVACHENPQRHHDNYDPPVESSSSATNFNMDDPFPEDFYDVAVSPSDAPAILGVVVTELPTTTVTSFLLNTELSNETISTMVYYGQSGILPSIVVVRFNGASRDTLGMYVSSIELAENRGASGVVYFIQGQLYDLNGNPLSLQEGDHVAFNYPIAPTDVTNPVYNIWCTRMFVDLDGDGVTESPFYITSKAGKMADSYATWATVHVRSF